MWQRYICWYWIRWAVLQSTIFAHYKFSQLITHFFFVSLNFSSICTEFSLAKWWCLFWVIIIFFFYSLLSWICKFSFLLWRCRENDDLATIYILLYSFLFFFFYIFVLHLIQPQKCIQMIEKQDDMMDLQWNSFLHLLHGNVVYILVFVFMCLIVAHLDFMSNNKTFHF